MRVLEVLECDLRQKRALPSQYSYQESLIRSKAWKEKCRQWENNTVEDLEGDIEKCCRKFGAIFNLENWAQTSDFPSVLTLSSQEI